MIDWLEEIWKEGEGDLPLTAERTNVFRRTEAVPAEEGVPETAAPSRQGESPLSVLYRRMGETLGVMPTAVSARRETVVQEAESSRPGLTVRELDLAVRRDSRRYDGGMSIY